MSELHDLYKNGKMREWIDWTADICEDIHRLGGTPSLGMAMTPSLGDEEKVIRWTIYACSTIWGVGGSSSVLTKFSDEVLFTMITNGIYFSHEPPR